MSQPVKNNSQLLYLQARQLFEQAKAKFEDGTIKTEASLITAVFNSFQEFFTSMGKPNMIPRYAPEDGPPWSEDYNSMMNEIQKDLELLFQEVDILGRSLYTDFNHNMVQADIIENQFQQVLDKMRDLETYAGMSGSNIEFGRDDFLNKDKIDYARIAGTPLEIIDGAVTLPVVSRENVAANAKITIIPGNRQANKFILGTESNGFPGNNTEIHSVTDDVLTNANYIPTFIGEENNHSDYSMVLDGNPNTWFEYEKVNVRDQDRIQVAKNLGWDYQVHENQTISWAEDPQDGKLKLHMQLTLTEEQTINQINCNMYTPSNYGAKTAIVKNILVSDGRGIPQSVMPKDHSDDQYSFHFTPLKAKVISIIFEQTSKYITDIGHIFYEKKMQSEDQAEYAMDMATKRYKYAPRVEGPLIALEDLGIAVNVSESNIEASYPVSGSGSSSDRSIGGTINRLMNNVDMDTVDMGVEKFEGFRWCIGIRDIEVFAAEYETEGELVTYPFYFDNPLDRISLNVSENIPSAFTNNEAMKYDWLQYFVSIDDGAMWYPITPLTHQLTNDEQPPKIYTIRTIENAEQQMDYKKAYIESEYPVYSLRLKIVGKRPDNDGISTFALRAVNTESDIIPSNLISPIMNSYMFSVETKGKLADSEESSMMANLSSDDDVIHIPGDDSDDPEDGGGSSPGGTPGPKPGEEDPDKEDKLQLWIDNKPLAGNIRSFCADHTLRDGHTTHELLVEGHTKGPYDLKTITVSLNGIDFGTQDVSGEKSTTYKFTLSGASILEKFKVGDRITVGVRTIDVMGNTASDSFIIEIIDCSVSEQENPDSPDDDPAESKLHINIYGKSGEGKVLKICDDKDYEITGSAGGPKPLEAITVSINGEVIYTLNVKETKGSVRTAFYSKTILNSILKQYAALNKEFTISATVVDEDGNSATDYFSSKLIDCTKDDPKIPDDKKKYDDLWLKIYDSYKPKVQGCASKKFSIAGENGGPDDIKTMTYYFDGQLVRTVDVIAQHGHHTWHVYDEVFTAAQFPGYFRLGNSFQLMVKVEDTAGRTRTETIIVEIVDCPDPATGGGSDYFRIVLDKKASKICECDELEFYGSVESSNPIRSVSFYLNGRSFDPNNMGPAPANDPCAGKVNPSPTPIEPDPVPTEPEPTPIPDSSVTEPNVPLSQFCTTNTSGVDTTYWVGAHKYPSTVVNGSLFAPREDFWGGRNDWLDLFARIGNLPANKSKVDTSKPFFAFLYDFYKKCNKTTVKLPQPFSKFNTWCDQNLQCLTKLERGSIYGTWVFKKPTVIHPGCEHYLEDNILDTMGLYLTDPKVKMFTYHWIDFNNVNPDAGVLAWVMDVPSLRQFLSYVNFEETAMQASIGNMKAMRPVDYVITAGKGPNESKWDLNEQVLSPYYVGTSHFKATDSYFVVQSLGEKVQGMYAAIESAVHELGHAISNYATESYPTPGVHKYSADAGKALHDYKEWYEISGWDSVSTTQDGKVKFTKSTVGFKLSNGKEAPVSPYGCTSPAEDFSDAFDYYVVNPQLLRDQYPKRYAFMEKYVKDMPSVEVDIFNTVQDMMNENGEINIEMPSSDNDYLATSTGEINLDFGEWLDRIEEDLDCGCKNKKKKKSVAIPVNQLEVSSYNVSSSGYEQPFQIRVPFWKLKDLGLTKDAPFKVEIIAIDSKNKEVKTSFAFTLYDCDKPPKDENGNPRVRDCYELESVIVHFYNQNTGRIESTTIPKSAIPYSSIDNGAGSGLLVAWKREAKGPALMMVKGKDDSGYAYQVHAVGLNYQDEYDQVKTKWATGIFTSTAGINNPTKMLGEPSKDSSWTSDIEQGDYTTSPTIAALNDYVIFTFDDEWNSKACLVDLPNFESSQYKPVDLPERTPIYDCNLMTHVVIQSFDVVEKKIKSWKIDISEKGKDQYDFVTKNGNIKFSIGWSSYFKGVAIQIQQASGNENLILLAVSIIYRDVYGDSVSAWSEKLRYRTNGAQYPEYAAGPKKEEGAIPWISNGVVDYTQATFVGKQGDMVAYTFSEELIDKMCPPPKNIDPEIGIDPKDPPDLPKITFPNPPSMICYGETDIITMTGNVTDKIGLKSVEYGLSVNGVSIVGPYTDQIDATQHTVQLSVSGDQFEVGDRVSLYITAINVFNVLITGALTLIVVNCDTEPPRISGAPTATAAGGKYCYSDVVNGTLPFKINTSDDRALNKWTAISGSWKEEESYPDGPRTANKTVNLPITIPSSVMDSYNRAYIPDSSVTVEMEAWDMSGKNGKQTITLTFTDCSYDPTPPLTPPVVEHDYDYQVMMKWGYTGTATGADIDLYAYDVTNAKQISYSDKTYTSPEGDKLWLDVDYIREHTVEQDIDLYPEIITIEGYKGKTISIGFRDLSSQYANLNKGHLPGIVTIYIMKQNGDLIKQFAIPDDAVTPTENSFHVCDIQIPATGELTTSNIIYKGIRGKLH